MFIAIARFDNDIGRCATEKARTEPLDAHLAKSL